MNYRKFFQLVAIIIVVLLAQSGAQAATWKLSHMRAEGSEVDADTKWFADEAKKRQTEESISLFIRQVC